LSGLALFGKSQKVCDSMFLIKDPRRTSELIFHSGLSIPLSLDECEKRVEHMVETLGDIAREESQHEISVLLKQYVFVPVASVCVRISQVLVSIEFDHDSQVRAQEIHFHVS
jgi:hypothetical protein